MPIEFTFNPFSRPLQVIAAPGEPSQYSRIRKTNLISATHRTLDSTIFVPLIAVANAEILELKLLNAQAGINTFAVFPAPLLLTRAAWIATVNTLSGATFLVGFQLENTLSNWGGVLITSFGDPITSITGLFIPIDNNIPLLVSEVFWNGYVQQV